MILATSSADQDVFALPCYAVPKMPSMATSNPTGNVRAQLSNHEATPQDFLQFQKWFAKDVIHYLLFPQHS